MATRASVSRPLPHRLSKHWKCRRHTRHGTDADLHEHILATLSTSECIRLPRSRQNMVSTHRCDTDALCIEALLYNLYYYGLASTWRNIWDWGNNMAVVNVGTWVACTQRDRARAQASIWLHVQRRVTFVFHLCAASERPNCCLCISKSLTNTQKSNL